jgi:acyl-coenzyme A synthetase/AMP-(fatty) acid ligase
LITWSRPREIEFRRTLPTTRIGKIDYRALVAENGETRRSDPRRAE